jgi:hypothetical protein
MQQEQRGAVAVQEAMMIHGKADRRSQYDSRLGTVEPVTAKCIAYLDCSIKS